MRYREEVNAAVEACLYEFESGGNGSEEKDAALFRNLISLGVKLGLEAAADRVGELGDPPPEMVAAEIRDIHPGYVLQAKP
jgi:hypothetical protein